MAALVIQTGGAAVTDEVAVSGTEFGHQSTVTRGGATPKDSRELASRLLCHRGGDTTSAIFCVLSVLFAYDHS